MNNTYAKLGALLARFLVTWFMGMLLSHLSPTAYNLVNNLIIAIGGQDALILAIGGTIAVLLGAAWIKLSSIVHLNTALNMVKGSSNQQVKDVAPNPLTALVNPVNK